MADSGETLQHRPKASDAKDELRTSNIQRPTSNENPKTTFVALVILGILVHSSTF